MNETWILPGEDEPWRRTIVSLSTEQQSVSRVMSVDWCSSARTMLPCEFSCERERFLAGDARTLGHVPLEELLCIKLDFRWRRRFHSLATELNGIFQNSVTKPMHENRIETVHRRRRRIGSVLKETKISLDRELTSFVASSMEEQMQGILTQF